MAHHISERWAKEKQKKKDKEKEKKRKKNKLGMTDKELSQIRKAAAKLGPETDSDRIFRFSVFYFYFIVF